MPVDHVIEGPVPAPEGTAPLAGKAKQVSLPTGVVISVYPVIEMSSSPDA